jgi:transcriptional regulator with XRE-family HTH domain
MLEDASMKADADAPDIDAPDIDARIARRASGLRATLGLSLDALAARSGVSRSMISLIERGESSATAAVLERLATGLGVPLASLFDPPAPAPGPIARRAEQPAWRDPASGYLRRNLSPPGGGSPIRLVEVEFPAGARVAFDNGSRGPRLHQQVWVIEGRIEVSVGEAVHRLDAGDCLALTLDAPTAYRNPTRRRARYLVAIVGAAAPAGPTGRVR